MCDEIRKESKTNVSKAKKIEKTFMNEYNEIENVFGSSFLNEIDREDSEEDE